VDKIGYIEVICGPMFSGKTSELLGRLERYEIGNSKFILIKPAIDKRFSEDEVVARGKKGKKSIIVNNAAEILEKVKENMDARIVAIDEAQFFDRNEPMNLLKVCKKLKKENYHIIINGLDMTYDGDPFGMMPDLMGIANTVLKLKAVCKYPGCGRDAEMSYKFGSKKKSELIETGDKETYEARCFLHWLIPSDDD